MHRSAWHRPTTAIRETWAATMHANAVVQADHRAAAVGGALPYIDIKSGTARLRPWSAKRWVFRFRLRR
jgi:hypothetical protein